jgi:hypothetical protein
MQALCVRLQLDPDVVTALRHYLAELHRFDAYAWLLGRAVAEDRLAHIGVSRTLEEDADALQALVTLCRLAGGSAVLIMAFDQLEGLQMRRDDIDGLRAFAGGLAQLFQACRNIAAISCVQSYFRDDLERAVPPAHMHRLAQDQGALTLLQASSAIQLVMRRLADQSELQQLRRDRGEPDPLWPLSREVVQEQVPAGGISARKLLWFCRDRFDAWRRGAAPRKAAQADALAELWDRRLRQEIDSAPDEGVYADGLLKLLDARAPGSATRSTIRDIDLVLSREDGDTGVAVCHSENMTSLAARLRRLLDTANRGQVRRLVVVRDERLPVSPSARATRERLAALAARGHRLLRPPAEAYAAVAAARKLLAEAAAGDLSIDDRPMSAEDLKSWLAGNLTRPLTDLMDALHAEEEAAQDDLLDRLHELLEDNWVLAASEAAARVGRPEQEILGHLARPQQLIGLLAGPPAVLFLRPEGIKRE